MPSSGTADWRMAGQGVTWLGLTCSVCDWLTKGSPSCVCDFFLPFSSLSLIFTSLRHR